MPYEYDSYYLWVDNSVTKSQVKTYCTNNDIPLNIARFFVGELTQVDANLKTIKCSWGEAPVIADGKIFEVDREVVVEYGVKLYQALGGLAKVKIFTHAECLAFITENTPPIG